MLYQGMVCLAGNQVWWTWEVEDVFRKVKKGHKVALKEYAKKLHKQIDDLVIQVRSPLSKNDRAKFNTVLIIDVHARDIIDGFVRDRYGSVFSFLDDSYLSKSKSEGTICHSYVMDCIMVSITGWILYLFAR